MSEVSVEQNRLGDWVATCPAHGKVASGPDREIIDFVAMLHQDCEEKS